MVTYRILMIFNVMYFNVTLFVYPFLEMHFDFV